MVPNLCLPAAKNDLLTMGELLFFGVVAHVTVVFNTSQHPFAAAPGDITPASKIELVGFSRWTFKFPERNCRVCGRWGNAVEVGVPQV